MELKHRIKRVADHVRDHLFEVASKRDGPYIDPEYRWLHTLRVTNIGRQLAEAEGGNVEQVVVACLLHDMAHFDDPENYRDHGRLAARLARPLLDELEYLEDEINAICYAVAAHVDDKADFDHSPTLEASIVSDADNIDRFDAYRILLYCQPEISDFKALAEKLKTRLEVLYEYQSNRLMGTETGHLLFKQKVDQQIAFYEAILAQEKLSRLPEIS
jgi:5'-deoxynucleotidase YfbR-like HD superfamily hydrolase